MGTDDSVDDEDDDAGVSLELDVNEGKEVNDDDDDDHPVKLNVNDEELLDEDDADDEVDNDDEVKERSKLYFGFLVFSVSSSLSTALLERLEELDVTEVDDDASTAACCSACSFSFFFFSFSAAAARSLAALSIPRGISPRNATRIGSSAGVVGVRDDDDDIAALALASLFRIAFSFRRAAPVNEDRGSLAAVSSPPLVDFTDLLRTDM